MKSSKTTKTLTIIVLVSVALLSLLIAIRSSKKLPETNYTTKEIQNVKNEIKQTKATSVLNPLEIKLVRQLSIFEIPESKLKISFLIETGIKEIRAAIPKGVPMEEAIRIISRAPKKTSYKIVDSYYDAKRERARVTFESSKKKRETIILHLTRGKSYLSESGSVVLVINGITNLSDQDRIKLLSIKSPLNYRIDAWDSTLDSTAYLLNRYGNGVILNIPLESSVKRRTISSPYTIMLNDSPREVELKISDMIRHAPATSAFAIYGGELVLESSDLINSIISSSKKRELAIFDIRKSTGSIVQSISKDQNSFYFKGGRVIEKKSVEDISLLLKRATTSAIRNRYQILYVDASANLAEAISKTLPYYKEKGIKLITTKTLENL
jgi:polysaccharide deacetylase 2 family uncharacterized protein YibQ